MAHLDTHVTIAVDGQELTVPGDASVAAGLAARGILGLRKPDRGVFCGMGSCHECVLEIDGWPGVRACLTPVRAGMRVQTGG